MNNQYIEFLAKELIRNKLVIFVGAGASIDSKLPSWNELVRKFAKELEIDKKWFSPEETLDIPETYYKKFGKVPYYEILDEIFSKKFEPNLIHEALNKLEVNYLITTNYDTLIEDKINENYDYDIVKKDEDLAHTSKRKMIIKMHGDLDYKNIVLRKSEFDAYEKSFPLISTFIKGLFTSNTILFVGYSLNDPNVKNIMSWIKNILKEDFRKVYLIEYDNDHIQLESKEESEDNSILNKIILPDLSKKEYLKKTKKELLKNKGELLRDFLIDINKRKEEKIKEEDIFIYSNLNYLTKINLKNLLKNSSIIGFSTDDKGLLNKKYLKTHIKNENIFQHKKMLIKSNIENINNISINEMFKNDPDLQNLLNIQEKYNELIEIILLYDMDAFNNFLKENSWLNQEYISISGYIFFEEYEIAEDKIEKILKQYKKENNKEKIVWTYYLLNIIEDFKINTMDITEKKIDLKKVFNRYFKRKTKLYNEIIESKTLNLTHKKMDQYLLEAKNGKNTSFGGFTPLNNAEFLIRDIYKFHILNGISFNFSELHKITKIYIEILLIAYKNDITEKDKLFGQILSLKTFEYSDYYFMLQVNYKDLSNLFKEYNIDNLTCHHNVINTLLKTLKNVLKLLDKNNNPFKTNYIHILENIFLLFYKNILTEIQFNEFLEIFINENKLYILYFDNHHYSNVQDVFNGILYKNTNYIKESIFKYLILNIISYKDTINSKMAGVLTYYYSTVISEKLNDTKELQDFFNRNTISIKLYFIRLLDDNIKEIEIKNIIEVLKKNFDLKIYKDFITLKYIKKNEELENKIIPTLDNIFKKKYTQNTNYDIIIHSLYSLLEKDDISKQTKNKIKNYDNEIFKNYLKNRNIENVWKYFSDNENFNYNCFSIDNLKSFTKFGMKKIINKGNKNKKFMLLIQNYLNSQSNNQIMNAYLDFSFEKIENDILNKQIKRSKIRKNINNNGSREYPKLNRSLIEFLENED